MEVSFPSSVVAMYILVPNVIENTSTLRASLFLTDSNRLLCCKVTPYMEFFKTL